MERGWRDEEGEKSSEEEDRRGETDKEREKGEPRGCRFTSTSSHAEERETPPHSSPFASFLPLFIPAPTFLFRHLARTSRTSR